jgi:hypothetical protein
MERAIFQAARVEVDEGAAGKFTHSVFERRRHEDDRGERLNAKQRPRGRGGHFDARASLPNENYPTPTKSA